MKTAHIISHTHWDREWYLPYEQHHMRLIMLIDQILDAIEKDPDFKSFHLDGQTICIDDYLQVKPQNREKLMKAIENGKIKIGPWYILQDAFLTSAEANVRNGYYGAIDCARYGGKTSVGYYPDTFGIYSQAPQLLKQLEIDNMIFGRGVTTTGFNNEVSNGFESKYSEMNIQSSNGDNVLGILFANWYSNGNEIPVESTAAKEYWDQKIAECEQYTNLNHLLFMNGCDHTPYQENVTEAIKVANQLYPDIEFKQSSFNEYLKAIKSEIVLDELTTISGELTSQRTDGLYTLVNTASSRINQKIQNAKIQDTYEHIVEPLSALYALNYKHEEIEYGWKKLMQNHPHDSICGCSVDSVHSTMDARFEDSLNVANHIINQTLIEQQEKLSNNGKLAFTVFNPTKIANTRHSIQVEYKRCEFGNDFRAARDQMKALNVPNLKLIDSNNNEINATITDLGIGFDYYLPDDKFRRPFYSRNLKVDFNFKFNFIGNQTFYLVETDKETTIESRNSKILENKFIKIEIEDDGQFVILNKKTNRSQSSLLEIFDQGDIGNEYMFGSVKNDKRITISNDFIFSVEDNNSMQVTKLTGYITVPKSAEDSLKDEQLEIIEYNTRKSGRSCEMIDLPIEIRFELDEFDRGVKVVVIIENKADDHRIRARFTMDDNNVSHFADSAFEILERTNLPLETWENPNNDQRFSKFVRLQNKYDGLTIATCGLHEYEVVGNCVDITLLRCTGELGDWGHFPTPEAQCKYVVNAEFYVIFDELAANNKHSSDVRTIFTSQPSIQLTNQDGAEDVTKEVLEIKQDDNSYISAIKRNLDNDLIIRLASNGGPSQYNINREFVQTNMLEIVENEIESKTLNSNQILTIKVKD